MSCALGFDFGTSGARAIVVDDQDKIVCELSTTYDLRHPASWRTALFELIGSIPSQLREQIEAIAIDGTSGTALLTDNHGTPLTEPLIYSDTCDIPQDSPAYAPSSSLAKLLHWQERIRIKNAYFLHQADWLGWQLHGQLGITDYHNALKLGWDIVNMQYPDWFPDTSYQLPKVVKAGQTIAPLLTTIAQEFHFPTSCLIKAGTTDSTASVIASFAGQKLTKGMAMTALGSTLVLKVLANKPIFHSTYGIYSHRWDWQGQTFFLAGGASNTGGAVLAKFFSPQALTALSTQIDPHIPSPLDYYPLLQAGERFPLNAPHHPPRLQPRPRDDREYLHGLLESIARIEKQGYDLLQHLGANYPDRIITTGGGAHNQTWQAIRERILGRPCPPARHTQAAYGTALLAKLR